MDFLLARQRAKQIAALLRFDRQDQTRIATAVSEIVRNAFEYAGGGRVEYFLDINTSDGPTFRIVVADNGKGIPQLDQIWNGAYRSQTGMGLGLIGSRRLLDDLQVETSPKGTTVSLLKRLPRNVSAPDIAELSTQLAIHTVGQPSALQSAALIDQNQELIRLLDEIRARESELHILNEELSETNRGVLVLYAELEDRARAVQHASELKTRFLSGVTHELRTPLNSIVSLSRLMLSHSDGSLSTEQEKQVNFILRSAQNMTELVNDLLDLARVEAGKAISNLTYFTVADLYAGLRGMFRPLATNPSVKLLFDIPSEPLRLHTDEGKLAQILRNFISNALKFTEHGTVTVSARPREGSPDWVTFTVVDTGIGIAPEHHEIVMQEWGQVEHVQQAAHGKQKGSGLGLPLSRSFAELLGGRIHFTSEPGQGSTFEVSLPALVSEPAPEPSAVNDLDQGHIIMADDDEVARYLLRRRLSAHTTAEITEACSGQEALDAIRRHRPHILFLDLVMPGLSGFEVVRQLRQDPTTADLPIVLHTSKTLSPEETRSLEAYDLTLIPKGSKTQGGTDDPDAPDEQSIQLQRALLQVGLHNMHEGKS